MDSLSVNPSTFIHTPSMGLAAIMPGLLKKSAVLDWS